MFNTLYTHSAIFKMGSLITVAQATVAGGPPVLNWLNLFLITIINFVGRQLEPGSHIGTQVKVNGPVHVRYKPDTCPFKHGRYMHNDAQQCNGGV